jgi:hypothetical protein
MFVSRELRDAAAARLAGVPLEDGVRGNVVEGDRGAAAGGGSSSLHPAFPPSLGDFTSSEYDRLSRENAEKRLDAREKSHYRAFDEVCWGVLL